MSSALAIHVHLLPALIPPGSLRGGVAVVIDVLRATTVMVQALASGCESVIPCAEIDEAQAVARSMPAGQSFLGGERGGLPIPGFDLGNSPADYTPELCRGRTLVMTTTNGTRAILASLEAERVLIAAFTNFEATVEELSLEFLKAHGRPIHFVCAGTEGHVSFEDTLLAGSFALYLKKSYGHASFGNDSAMIATAFWHDEERRIEPVSGRLRLLSKAAEYGARLARALSTGRGGQNVHRIGLAKDIPDVANVDRYSLVAQLQRDPVRIVTAYEPGRSSETP